MTERPGAWLVMALTVALVAGCGSSRAPTSSSAAASSRASSQRVEACKQHIPRLGLEEAEVAKFEAICRQASTSNPATLEQLAREACLELLKDLKVPPGPARSKLVATCKRHPLPIERI